MSPLGRIYIAGPMRGRPDHNFPAFRAAEARFAAAGWDVVSPVTIGETLCGNDPAVPGSAYLRADVRDLSTCDAIALLPEWDHSTGARCEVVVAVTIGLAVFDAMTGERIAAPDRVVCNGGYDRPAGPVESLDVLLGEIRAWANATFTVATPASKAEHLRREATELCADPTDLEEMADIFILLAHASDGMDLAGAVRRKLEKNRRRIWGRPDAQGVVEHVRGTAGASA